MCSHSAMCSSFVHVFNVVYVDVGVSLPWRSSQLIFNMLTYCRMFPAIKEVKRGSHEFDSSRSLRVAQALSVITVEFNSMIVPACFLFLAAARDFFLVPRMTGFPQSHISYGRSPEVFAGSQKRSFASHKQTNEIDAERRAFAQPAVAMGSVPAVQSTGAAGDGRAGN